MEDDPQETRFPGTYSSRFPKVDTSRSQTEQSCIRQLGLSQDHIPIEGVMTLKFMLKFFPEKRPNEQRGSSPPKAR